MGLEGGFSHGFEIFPGFPSLLVGEIGRAALG